MGILDRIICRGPRFTRSSYTHPGGIITRCVEVSINENAVLVRDSKNPELKPLQFTQDEWKAFVLGVKNNEFDLK